MKKGIISGMVFMSILLVGCNGEEKGGSGVESEQEYPSLSSLYPSLFAIPSFSPLHPRLLHAYPSLFALYPSLSSLYPSLFAILSLYPSLLMFRSLCLTISPQKNYNSVLLNCSSFLFHNPILSMFLYSVCF